MASSERTTGKAPPTACKVHPISAMAKDQQAQVMADIDQQARDDQRAMASQRLQARLRSAGISPRFAHASLANFVAETNEQRRVLGYVRRYAQGFAEQLQRGRCLMLVGPCGTGKTHLAMAVLAEVIHAGYKGRYATAADISAAVRATYRGEGSESKALDAFIEPDLLVLDEIGVLRDTDHERHCLYRTIDGRYQAQRPAILCGNVTVAEAEEALGEQAFSRLQENGGIRLSLVWDDYRAGRANNDQRGNKM